MRNIVTLVLVGLIGAGAIACQARESDAVERELIKLTRDLAMINVTHDRAAVEKILADDFTFTHSNGVVMSRSEEISQLISPDTKWEKANVDSIRVRMYGDVGVTTGSETYAGTARGMQAGQRLFTMIFVKQKGQWRCIGGQFTLAPDPPGQNTNAPPT